MFRVGRLTLTILSLLVVMTALVIAGSQAQSRPRSQPDAPSVGVARARQPSDASAKRLLAPSDFTYIGFYDLQTNGLDSTYGQGLTHRYVGNDLRLLTLQLTGELHEISLQGRPFGSTIEVAETAWDLSASDALNNFNGLWWEAAQSRLWVTSSQDYTDVVQQVRLYTMRLDAGRRPSNVRGPVGLAGINAKRVYGGVQPVPEWFQHAFGVGPYVVGWGGYTSLVAQGGSASLGPAMYAIPDPAAYAVHSNIPTSAFRTIMDHASGSVPNDWYRQGAPTTGDRGRRLTHPINYFDDGDPRQNPGSPPVGPPASGAQWLSPAPDGFGRFVWGDSYYNTGMWIDLPDRHGFVMVASLCGGRCWYQSSTLAFDRRVFELHIWDPARLGEGSRGTLAPWNVRPASMTQLQLPLGNAVVWEGNTPVGNIGGATFDPLTRRMYLLGLGMGATVHHSRIFVLQLAP